MPHRSEICNWKKREYIVIKKCENFHFYLKGATMSLALKNGVLGLLVLNPIQWYYTFTMFCSAYIVFAKNRLFSSLCFALSCCFKLFALRKTICIVWGRDLWWSMYVHVSQIYTDRETITNNIQQSKTPPLLFCFGSKMS